MTSDQLQPALPANDESERTYRQLFELAFDGIFISCPGGRYVEVNRRACEMTDYARPELLQLRPEDVFVEAGPARRPVDWTVLVPGRTYRIECDVRRRDGTTFPVEVSAGIIEGNLVHAIVRDVTERRRFEQQLVRAKEDAEQMNRLKSAFLANMSHEIRTPLTGIIGFSAVLAEEVRDDQRELARLIERGGTRLLDTLNSVLELSMLQAGSLSVQYRRLDVVEVARECVAYGRPIAGAKGLQMNLRTSVSVLPCFLDEAGVARILHNLIGNAIKFTKHGEVTVEVECDRGDVVLRVRDTGIGIDADFLPLLFDEFRQESTGIKRTYEGAGLGLAITRHLVERLDGAISVESEKGRGTVFTVRLPCLQAAPAERPVPA